MRNRFIFITIFSFCVGCNQLNKKAVNNLSQHTISVDSDKNESPEKENNLSKKSLFAKDTLIFNLSFDSLHENISTSIHVCSVATLGAVVYSKDKKANIRISQVGFPDSTFDGPLGRSIKFKIKDTGEYKIIAGENMMAGDKWFGKFNLKVWLE